MGSSEGEEKGFGRKWNDSTRNTGPAACPSARPRLRPARNPARETRTAAWVPGIRRGRTRAARAPRDVGDSGTGGDHRPRRVSRQTAAGFNANNTDRWAWGSGKAPAAQAQAWAPCGEGPESYLDPSPLLPNYLHYSATAAFPAPSPQDAGQALALGTGRPGPSAGCTRPRGQLGWRPERRACTTWPLGVLPEPEGVGLRPHPPRLRPLSPRSLSVWLYFCLKIRVFVN